MGTNALTGLRRVIGWQIRCYKYRRIEPTLRFGYLCSALESDFEQYVSIGELTILYRTSFGRYSYCGSQCQITHCEVGRFCSIGSNVRIGLWKHPVQSNVSTHPIFYSPLGQAAGATWVSERVHREFDVTKVGSDVWIGDNALVMAGISIGHGAVVGAGAVVTKDVPPYSIVGGNPAKTIRARFGSTDIALLLRESWWDWPVEKIRKNCSHFLDINDFRAFCENA